MKKDIIRKTAQWIGRILTIAACCFLVYKLWGYRESVKVVPTAENIIRLILCSLAYVGMVLLCPVIYRDLLYLTTGKCFSYEKVANLYCRTNLFKYLPGNVMQYVGRNEFAVDEDLKHAKVALATVFEIVVVAGSAFLMAVIFSGKYGLDRLTEAVGSSRALPVIICAGIASIIAICIFAKVAGTKRIFSDISISKAFVSVFGLILYNSVIFVIGSRIYYGTLGVVGIELPGSFFLTGIGLYCLAFLIGYVTPGAPGGIGIREVVLVSFFSGVLSEEQVLAGAVLFRIISVVGDFLAYVIVLFIGRRPARHKGALFVTTKNLDYIRNVQETALLKARYGNVDIIGSYSKHYAVRLLKVFLLLFFRDLKGYETVFIGFAPQLIIPVFKYKLSACRLEEDFFISLLDTFAWDRKLISDKSIMGHLFRYLDSLSLARADHIICDTKAHGDFFVSEFGAYRDKLEVLYLEADKEIYHPIVCEKPEGLMDRFVVLYFGSILPLQGIEVVLSAIERLKDDNRIFFYVIGPLGKREKPDSENAEYISWLSQKELAEKIAVADLCLAGHFNDKIGKAARTIPGKAYIYDAMQKPMILGDNGANREIFDESRQGISFVPMGRADLLAEKIKDLSRIHES